VETRYEKQPTRVDSDSPVVRRSGGILLSPHAGSSAPPLPELIGAVVLLKSFLYAKNFLNEVPDVSYYHHYYMERMNHNGTNIKSSIRDVDV